VVKTDTENICI